jgi:hypothetical protein
VKPPGSGSPWIACGTAPSDLDSHGSPGIGSGGPRQPECIDCPVCKLNAWAKPEASLILGIAPRRWSPSNRSNIMVSWDGRTGGHRSGQADPVSRLPHVVLCRVWTVHRGHVMPWKRCPQCRGAMLVMGQCAHCGWQDNALLRAAETGLIPPPDWLPEGVPVELEEVQEIPGSRTDPGQIAEGRSDEIPPIATPRAEE